MRIAICDDNKQYALFLKAAIEKYFRTCNLCCLCDVYTDPAELLGADATRYAVAFLDVDMPINGLSCAATLRETNAGLVVVFVSEYLEYSLKAFEVSAFRYLLKQDIDKTLPKCLGSIVFAKGSGEQRYTVSFNRKENYIPVSDIVLFRSNKRQVEIICNDNNAAPRCTVYKKIRDMESDPLLSGFLRTHNSYFVNMNYIVSIRNYTAVLKDGTTLPVSRSAFRHVQQKFILWKGREAF